MVHDTPVKCIRQVERPDGTKNTQSHHAPESLRLVERLRVRNKFFLGGHGPYHDRIVFFCQDQRLIEYVP